MPTYTVLGKTILCPCHKITITLNGRYRFTDNPSNPYEAKFCYAECPLVENSKRPVYEQSEEFKYHRCTLGAEHCESLHDFPATVDTSKTTYIK